MSETNQNPKSTLVFKGKAGDLTLRRTKDLLDITADILGTSVEVWKDRGPYGQTFHDPVTGMSFVWVPGGSFEMGDSFNEGGVNEKPLHKVTLPGFYMGRYAVTQGEWMQIMGDNPSFFQRGGRYPVEDVSWHDCQKFIKKLNQIGMYKYTLPTEAQWEYAARERGKKVRFGTGKDTIGQDEANFDGTPRHKKPYSRVGEYSGESLPVDSFAPNALGLYQMTGNVWEWCQDLHSDTYADTPTDGSSCETWHQAFRVIRGGSWYSPPWALRVTFRGWDWPTLKYGNLGLRLVLPVQAVDLKKLSAR